MLDEKKVVYLITTFLHDSHKKILLIVTSQVIDIQQMMSPILNKSLYYFDMSQSPDVDSAVANIPVAQIPIFIFDNSKLDNHYMNYQLERWQCKTIIICHHSLLHPTLDPSIYFVPRAGEKIQKHLFSCLKFARPTVQSSVDNTIQKRNAVEKSAQTTLLRDHFLNKDLWTNNPMTMQMLADHVYKTEAFKNFLFQFIFASCDDERMQIAAANAITILNFAGVSFSGINLSRIKIPCANLDDAVLDQANLSNADLRYVNLYRAWLRQAKLNKTYLEGVKLGGEVLLSLKEEMVVSAIKYSPTGKLIAISDRKGHAYLWDLTRLQCIAMLSGHRHGTWPIKHLAFSRDGQFLATGCDDGYVCVWHVASQLLIARFGHSETIEEVLFSADGSKVISRTIDSVLWIWDVKTSQLFGPYEGHAKKLAISAAGMLLAVCAGEIKLWYLSESGHLCSTKGKRTEQFSREIIGYSSTLASWNVKEVKPYQTIKDKIFTAEFMPDEKTIVFVTESGEIKYWDSQTSKLLPQTGILKATFTSAFFDPIEFSADRKQLLFSKGNIVYLYSLTEMRILNHFSASETGMKAGGVNHFSFSPSGEEIAIRTSDSHLVSLRQTNENDKQLQKLNSNGLTACNGGKWILTASNEQITIHLANNGIKIYEWHQYFPGMSMGSGWTMAVSSNYEWLVIVTRIETFYLCHLPSRSAIQLKNNWQASSVAFFPDNRYFVISDFLSHSFTIWSVSEKKIVAIHTDTMLELGMNDGTGSNCVAVSRNGCFLSIGPRDKNVEIWDISSSKKGFVYQESSKKKNANALEVKLPTSHSLPYPSPVTCMAFSSDEKFMAGGCYDGSLYVWGTAKCVDVAFEVWDKIQFELPIMADKYHAREIRGVAILNTLMPIVISVGLDCQIIFTAFGHKNNKPLFRLTVPVAIQSIHTLENNCFVLHAGDGSIMCWQYNINLTSSRDLRLIWRLGQSGFNCDDAEIDENIPADIQKYFVQSPASQLSNVTHAMGKLGMFSSSPSASKTLAPVINYKQLEDIKTRHRLPELSQETLEKALRQAARNNKIDDLKFLIEIVKNINARDSNPISQKTALDWANEKGHKGCISILLAAGAINTVANTKETSSNTDKTPSITMSHQH